MHRSELSECRSTLHWRQVGCIPGTLQRLNSPVNIAEHVERMQLAIDDELLAALEVFSLMFAHLEEAASAYVAANPGTDLKAFYRWASTQTATGEQEMIATLEGIKQEIMNAQAYAIHDRLVEAFDAFSLPMLKVQASCWWSLSHKTLEQVLHSEQVLKAHNVNGRLQGSIHSPLPHRSMIYSDGLLDSFFEVYLQSL